MHPLLITAALLVAVAVPSFATLTIDANGVTATVTRGADAAIFYAGRTFIPNIHVLGATYGGVIVSDSDHDGVVRFDLNPGQPSFLRWLVVDMSNGAVQTGGQGTALPTPAVVAQEGWDGRVSRLSVPSIGYGAIAWIKPGVGGWYNFASDGAPGEDDGVTNGRIGLATSIMKPFSGAPPPPATVESGDVVMGYSIDLDRFVLATVDLAATGPGRFLTQVERSKCVEGTTIALVVTRDGGSDGAASLAYKTDGGTTLPGVDYEPVSGVLEFAPGETKKTIFIRTLNANDAYDSDRDIRVALAGTGAPSDAASVYVPLLDDDPPPVLSFENVTVREGGDGVHHVPMTATLTGATNLDASVTLSTVDSHGGGGPVTTLTFHRGETKKTFDVVYAGNSVHDADRVVVIKIIQLFECTVSGTGTLTIRDDDPPPPRHRAARH